jgi:anti-sigma regulatory factor (Ser/Thr protein kinase)
MTMTAEAPAAGRSPEKIPGVAGGIPVLIGGAAPVAVRVFSGVPAQASQVRRWVRALAPACGLEADVAELAVSELFANAVLHTRSGQAGGKVTVAVTADGILHIHDYGTAGPCPGLIAGPKAGGDPREDFRRGLTLVTALSVWMAHLPAARCSAAGPDDPAAMAGGCCTCCLLLTPAAPHSGPQKETGPGCCSRGGTQ